MRFFHHRRQPFHGAWVWVGAVLALALCLPPPLFAHGAYHEVLAILEKQMAGAPHDAGLLRQRAALHLTHEEWDKALADTAAADRLDGRAADSGWIRGCALRESGRLEEALAALSSYVEAHPRQALGWRERARVRSRLGMRREAAADFREAMRWAPRLELEDVVECADLEKKANGAAAALAVVERGIEQLGAPEALLRLAVDFEWEAGEVEGAKRRVEWALERSDDTLYWLTRRAEIAEAAGEAAPVERAWSEVRRHVSALPSLRRGAPEMRQLLERAGGLAGEKELAPVVAAPKGN